MSEQEYFEQVAFLEENNPNEPLLSRLKRSFSEANALLYLPVALERIPEHVEDEIIFEKKYTPTENEKNELSRQYGYAYGRACKAANKLHDYKRGTVPPEVIDEILKEQKSMDIIADKLDGTYSEKATDEPKVYEGEDKYKRIQVLRSSISRKKAELQKLADSEDTALIAKKENQLFQFNLELKTLEGKNIQ